MAAKKKKPLKPGTKVRWNTSQGETTGKVVKRQTRATKIKTHKVAASKDNPEYIVRSDKSGRTAAHKRRALKRAG
jgi:Hypervirulence associated proteins TUDOR domain